MIKVEDGGEVSDLWVVGDLRTLLFAGGQGLANSTFRRWAGACELDFFACGWLARFIYGT
jgi:hypothetical protein